MDDLGVHRVIYAKKGEIIEIMSYSKYFTRIWWFFGIWIGEELNHRENWRFFTPKIRGFPADCPFNSGSFASGTGTSSNMEDHDNHDIIICETLLYFKSMIILKFRNTTIWNRCSGKNAVLPHVILQLLHTFTVFFSYVWRSNASVARFEGCNFS